MKVEGKHLFYIPMSWLYGLGVYIRHALYDNRLLPSVSVGVPTICVGNLAVGGTGKTPMVEYIVRLLLNHGFHPAVLSRGYKRRTRGFVLANAESTALTIGDEAMQIHSQFPDVPVAVCEQRVRGIHRLQKSVGQMDVVVLDDAFQHRHLRCGLNILLTPYDNLYIDDHLLPWGRLRDLPQRAIKADAVVVTKCPEHIRPIDMRVVDNRLHLPAFQKLYFSTIDYAPIQQKGTPLILCGIGQPHYLYEHVRVLYPQVGMMAYDDHHAYTSADIENILQRAETFDWVLTTEKDMQRLRHTDLEQRLATLGKPLVCLPVTTRIVYNPAAFDRQIITYVRENNKKE